MGKKAKVLSACLLVMCGVWLLAGEGEKGKHMSKGEVDNLLKEAERVAKQRKELEEKLIEFVRLRTSDKELIRKKRKAVELLGKIGTQRCVDVLIEVLDVYFDEEKDVVVDHDGLGNIPPTPAMKALVELGPLAVEKLVDAIGRNYDVRQVLGMMKCHRLVEAVLADRIERAHDVEEIYKLGINYVLSLPEKMWKPGVMKKIKEAEKVVERKRRSKRGVKSTSESTSLRGVSSQTHPQ